MALKQANTLAPSNVSASGFALADARHIGGHRVVASLAALYALQDWQLLNPDETDTAMALGQQWYVKGDGFYRLTNWGSRKAAGGWTKVVDPNNIDTTLFQIVSALPTSGINKNRIYIVASTNKDTEGKNIYAEYIYTGDTSAAYNASKWEKLGEYTPTVDLSPYSQHVANKQNPHGVTKEQVGLGNVTNEAQIPLSRKGVANGVATLDANGKVTDAQLWDATDEKHGLMTADQFSNLDMLSALKEGGALIGVANFDSEVQSISNDQIEDSKSPSDILKIIYVQDRKRFYALSGGKYYTSWGNMEVFFGVPIPAAAKVYIKSKSNISDGEVLAPPVLYIGDSKNGLIQIAKMDDLQVMTNEEIDALFA